MKPDGPEILRRFAPWRRRFEYGFWIVLYTVNGVANSVTVALDLERRGVDAAAWEAAVWESSSALSMLLLVWPVVWFTRRFPLQWEGLGYRTGLHVAAGIGYSLAHVVLMVAMRKFAYALASTEYSFGHWPSELFYEYLKDARTYAGVVLIIEGYRFVLRRLQGEARWPDSASPEIESEPSRPSRFLVKMLGREFLLPAERIEHAGASGNYVNLHVDGRDYPLRSTMKDLMANLDAERFRRAHRSYIVNLDFVAQIEPIDSGDARITMRDGAVLPCSRKFRPGLTRGFGRQ
mgnify:CR=1 FL=1